MKSPGSQEQGDSLRAPCKSPSRGNSVAQMSSVRSISLPQSNETDLSLSINARLIRPWVVGSIPFYLRQADCSIGSNFVALRLERVRRYPIQAGETDDLETC